MFKVKVILFLVLALVASNVQAQGFLDNLFGCTPESKFQTSIKFRQVCGNQTPGNQPSPGPLASIEEAMGWYLEDAKEAGGQPDKAYIKWCGENGLRPSYYASQGWPDNYQIIHAGYDQNGNYYYHGQTNADGSAYTYPDHVRPGPFVSAHMQTTNQTSSGVSYNYNAPNYDPFFAPTPPSYDDTDWTVEDQYYDFCTVNRIQPTADGLAKWKADFEQR